MDDESTALIPTAVDHPAEPKQPETALGKKRHKRHAKAGDDPLDRFVARRRAQAILALKLEGRKPRDIAAELGIPVKSVYWALYQLRRGGHLESRREMLEAVSMRIKPLIIERLEERLEDPDVSETLLVSAAQGTGIFVSHQKTKSDSPTTPQQLIVKFELPKGDGPITAVGEIHGAIEGEVITP